MSTDELTLRIARELSREPGSLGVFLAGSRASGTHHAGSDIDLLVISRDGEAYGEVYEEDGVIVDIVSAGLPAFTTSVNRNSFLALRSSVLVPLHDQTGLLPTLVTIVGDALVAQIPTPELIAQVLPYIHGYSALIRSGQIREPWHRYMMGVDLVGGGTVVASARHRIPPFVPSQHIEALTAAGLDRDTAEMLRQWYTGDMLEERLAAAVSFADRVVEGLKTPTEAIEYDIPTPAPLESTSITDEKMRGFHIGAKHYHGRILHETRREDPVRRAIAVQWQCWYLVPSILEFGGMQEVSHHGWYPSLCASRLATPFADLFLGATVGSSLKERCDAAVAMTEAVLGIIEPMYEKIPETAKRNRERSYFRDGE
jgi:hypothetical protein